VGGARTPGEETAELDEELAASLRQLDGLLLSEQQELAEAAASGGAGGSGGTSGAVRSGSGGSAGPGSTEGEGSTDPESGPSSTGGEGRSSGGAVGGGGVGGGDTGGRVPDDVGDGSDDDIIARQLREAAMAEDDPELRERLWQEYRDYKASATGQSDSSTSSSSGEE
jgi:hypothetical protein